MIVSHIAPAAETNGEAYRAGRRIAEDILHRRGAAALAQVVHTGDLDEEAGRLTGLSLHHHWGVRSILRERA
jgi:hypothetical protein